MEKQEQEQSETKHIPVMAKELIEIVDPKRGGIYIDCTLGGAGHLSTAIEKVRMQTKEGQGKSKEKTIFIGIDQDQEAIKRAEKLFETKKKENINENFEIILVKENFENLTQVLQKLDISLGTVNAIWADLGTSEDQLKDEARGFSFLSDAELDMRMDKETPIKAADLVNGLNYKELVELFTILADLGQYAKKIARAIVEKRKEIPILTTKQLVEIIRQAVPSKSIGSQRLNNNWQRKAKLEARVFQSLRIAVNHELDSLKRFLPQALEALLAQDNTKADQDAGKFVVISFHSGEDRIVKHFFNNSVKNSKAEFIERLLTPTIEEIKNNQKASSAKLRAIKKCTI